MLAVTISMAVISANVIKDLAEMERIAEVFSYTFILVDTLGIILILCYKLLQHNEDCLSGIQMLATLTRLITIYSMIACQYFIIGLK